jgi:hypothetical protein
MTMPCVAHSDDDGWLSTGRCSAAIEREWSRPIAALKVTAPLVGQRPPLRSDC